MITKPTLSLSIRVQWWLIEDYIDLHHITFKWGLECCPPSSVEIIVLDFSPLVWDSVLVLMIQSFLFSCLWCIQVRLSVKTFQTVETANSRSYLFHVQAAADRACHCWQLPTGSDSWMSVKCWGGVREWKVFIVQFCVPLGRLVLPLLAAPCRSRFHDHPPQCPWKQTHCVGERGEGRGLCLPGPVGKGFGECLSKWWLKNVSLAEEMARATKMLLLKTVLVAPSGFTPTLTGLAPV